jgi:hypothetical protein
MICAGGNIMNNDDLFFGLGKVLLSPSLAIALVVGASAVGVTALLVAPGPPPATYADCILAYTPRNSGPAVHLIAKACREKYPEEKLDFSAYATDESKR